MMKLNLRYEYKKLYMLIKMEIKRIFNHISNVVLLALVLIIFVNMFEFLYNNKNFKLDSKVALAIEDNSIEVSTLIGNITNNKLKDIIEFEDVTLEEGLELLKANEVVAIINVKKGTTDILNNGQNTSFDLYINDETNITVKFLVEYINSLVEVLNEGQHGAMVYWNVMKANGHNFDERLDELNNIALNYMSTFLIRGSVFEDSVDLDKYSGSLINYYFTSALILIAIILTILYQADIIDDFNKGRITRIFFSGYKWWDIYAAKVLVGTLFVSIILMSFEILFTIILRTFSYVDVFKTALYVVGINLIINLIVMVFHVFADNNIFRNITMFTFWTCMIYASGIIIPLTSMNSVFKYMSKVNFITIGHNAILNSRFTILKTIVFIIYLVLFMFLLYLAHRKRECVK